MFSNNRRNLSVVFVGMSMLALGACASNGDVEKAQSTANEALAQAQQAQQTAQAASQQAQQANSAANRGFQQSLQK